MYRIKKYSYRQAAKLGVKIYPSSRPGKKIDVYKNGLKIATIGARGYFDFPTYAEKFGIEYAKKRRKLYHIRHAANKKPGTPGYYASKILW